MHRQSQTLAREPVVVVGQSLAACGIVPQVHYLRRGSLIRLDVLKNAFFTNMGEGEVSYAGPTYRRHRLPALLAAALFRAVLRHRLSC